MLLDFLRTSRSLFHIEGSMKVGTFCPVLVNSPILHDSLTLALGSIFIHPNNVRKPGLKN